MRLHRISSTSSDERAAAKGAGAHGYFEVTAGVSKYSRAKVFSKIGKVRRCDDGSDDDADARRAASSSSCTAAAASLQTAAHATQTEQQREPTSGYACSQSNSSRWAMRFVCASSIAAHSYVRSLLDGGRRARQRRHGARPARIRRQALHVSPTHARARSDRMQLASGPRASDG